MDILNCLMERLAQILKIYISELSDFMDEEHILFLSDSDNLEKLIQFSDAGTGAWCNHKKIFFGNDTSSFIEVLRQNPLYGTQPYKPLVINSNFIDNELDYIDYMQHFILAGKQEIDFYLDMLPHEAMHLIGVSGGIIGEGVTEKLTREICFKHKIHCAPICHSKETKLACLIEKIVGKNILTRAGFENGFFQYTELEEHIDMKLGKGSFAKIYGSTQPTYFETYINKKYQTPFEKFKAYRELNFDIAYAVLSQNCS